MLRISWNEHCTDQRNLTKLNTTGQLVRCIVRRKLSLFGNTTRGGGCEYAGLSHNVDDVKATTAYATTTRTELF